MSENPQIRQTNFLIMILKKSPSDEPFVRKFRILPVSSIARSYVQCGTDKARDAILHGRSFQSVARSQNQGFCG